MRAATVVAVAVALASASCGDDDASTTELTSQTTTAAVFECPEPVPVAALSDLLEVLGEAEWDWAGSYTSGPQSPDLEVAVQGTIVLESAQVPLPVDCLDREDCRGQAVLRVTEGVGGALVEGDPGLFEGDTLLTLTDTAVRLSLSMLDTHPGPFNYVPLVTVRPPCGTPCAEGQLACSADGNCYADFDAFCRRCLGFTNTECACRTLEGPVEDGSACEYWVSGDVLEVGVCRTGVCTTE